MKIGSIDPVLKYAFDDTNKTIEKWTDIFYSFVFNVGLPLGAVPMFTLPYYFYYFTESGNDVFAVFEFMK